MSTQSPAHGKRILLVVAGGIAAYKCLELVRRLAERGATVRSILTRAGCEFITPLSLASLSDGPVYTDLFALEDGSEMGHIRLSREADLVVVAPATADIMARMAAGIADDLATAMLLANQQPLLVAPAMHTEMWRHPATQRNIRQLEADGVKRIGPAVGSLASGDYGEGRMVEAAEILDAIEAHFAAAQRARRLAGRRALVTSGPTYEAIDPVRFIGNRSSGKQGHAIAGALARLGAETTLVAGPTGEADPDGVTVVHIESAREMLKACQKALPVDVAICAAAVSDWRSKSEGAQKLKKDGAPPRLELVENPDILATLSKGNKARPALVVGFAAETDTVVDNAVAKRRRKGCDWILANDVSAATGTFGGNLNLIHLITATGVDSWPKMSKREVAERLAARIAEHFEATAQGR